MPTDDEKARSERCRQIAGELLGHMPHIPDRGGVFVTVVVHERDGTGRGIMSSCITPHELAHLSKVLHEASGDAAELALDTRSPWERMG